MLAILLLSCNFVTRLVTGEPPTPSTEAPAAGQGSFSEITFCEDVTDDGEPVNPTDSFPAGTSQVWAFFTYNGMQDGQAWGRLWELDGEVYADARSEAWKEGESGWVAYSISDSDNAPLAGSFTLTLYIGDEAVQQASFDVQPPEVPEAPTTPAFGQIQFANDITEDRVPVGEASEFESGTTIVYAVFPYYSMSAEQGWGREWLYNGEVIDTQEGAWGEGPAEGITYIWFENQDGLGAGTYTLKLYLDGELSQSADFEVFLGEPTPTLPPASPDEIIDADLMPAWEILYYAQDQYAFIHEIAQFALDHRIEISMEETSDSSVMAYYAYSESICQPNYQPGYVKVGRQTWNESSWEELAGVLAHELKHAMQHYDGHHRCGCSIEKEHQAFIAQIYTWFMIGRQDLIENELPASIWEADGSFSSDNLWWAIKYDYGYGEKCPDY
jgi:hypothetical protein